jgi:glycosyltransferase involved in cell wall biosynthesis
MEKIEISIITPSYNEEKHIGECIESVLRQNWPHFNMVVVDDASVDKTTEIVEKYVAADERIKLIRQQENMGAAMARNVALDNVEGDYLLFLDADDWILPGMLSDLAEMIHQYGPVDMFRLKGRNVYMRGVEPVPGNAFETRLYKSTDLVRENKMSGFMHNLFVKTRIVKDNQIRFSDGMVMLEDQEFTLKCMIHSEQVLYFTKQNYMYYQHPESVSKNFRKEHFSDILNCASSVYQCAEDTLEEKELTAYRGYAYLKAVQYLKRVLKDRDVSASYIRSDMDRFLETIDFEWNKRQLLQLYTRGIIMTKVFTRS